MLAPGPTAATPERVQAAVELLKAHREAYERERRNRRYLVSLARQYGVPTSIIADTLGITGAGVRKILSRINAPEAADE